MEWALRILGPQTRDVAIYGSGFWVFFDGITPYGGCEPGGYCQLNIIDLEGLRKNAGVVLYNLNTHNVADLVRIGGDDGTIAVPANGNEGSWGSVIAAFLGYA